jgi:site-specific DNA-methyltransferase (adenine-specific)
MEVEIMKPYYKNELTTIYNSDCLEVMKQYPDNHFDLCLTDPPYGINRNKLNMGKGGGVAEMVEYSDYDWDSFIPSDEHFKELIRISKNQIIFGGNYFIENLTNSSCWIVWDKDNGSNDFADCELAWTSFNTAVRKYKFTWNGMIQEDMHMKEKRYHPTQKPIELFVDILKDYTKENDKVLDCFGGSGTTAIACEKLGLQNVIIDKKPQYCEIIKERLSKLQMRLDI